MIIINEKKYAANTTEVTNSLFESGGTVYGYYEKKSNGILFLDLQKKPFAFLCCNEPKTPFFVSCSEVTVDNVVQIRYMFSTCSKEEEILGLNKLSYLQNIELGLSILKALTSSPP